MTKTQKLLAKKVREAQFAETIRKFDEENPDRLKELRKLMGKEFDRLMKEEN